MAVSSPAVLAAYAAGAGSSSVATFDTFALVLGGVGLVWVAWAIAGLGERYMDGSLKELGLLSYAVRALVILFVLAAVLVW